MQDRYVGDVGDYIKYGMLDALARARDPHRLRIGICWYLAEDETHNADGKHVTYLSADTSQARALERCNPGLYKTLAVLVGAGRRNIRDLERSGALPANTTTWRTVLRRSMTIAERAKWHQSALHRLRDADVVFLDPDNGICSLPRRPPKHDKYALLDEVASYTARGQTAVVYHHADRTAPAAAQIRRRANDLRAATGVDPLNAILVRRGSARFFFTLPAAAHRNDLSGALNRFAARWAPHVELRDTAQLNDA